MLLFSGKLSDRKGVDLLIDAARALPDTLRRRVVLVFVGQGERREALVATACLPPAVDVRFAGFQNQSALSRFYHAADLLVLPSRTAETWGLVVNEALHHGLPCVVSSRVGCGPDLILPERTGTCAPTGSATELAAAIAGACGLAGRREIRDACRDRAALYGLEPAAAGIAPRVSRCHLRRRRRAELRPMIPRLASLARDGAGARRLLIVGHADPVHVGSHFLHAAASLGHDARLCDTAPAFAAPRWRQRLDWWVRGRRPSRLRAFSEHVVELARRDPPDVVLTTGLAPLDARALEMLAALGATRLNFLTDDPWRAGARPGWFIDTLPAYDRVFTPRHANLGDLQAAGALATYLPFAYSPNVHFPEAPAAAERVQYDADVVFAGGADADRVEMAAALIRAGFRVALYGGYWERDPRTRDHARGFLDATGVRKAVHAARVCLCLVRRANRDGNCMRTFEVPAMGGCMLAEATDDHRQLFGTEDTEGTDTEAVSYFGTPEEAVEKTRSLVGDPDRRAAPGAAGVRRRDRRRSHLCRSSRRDVERDDARSRPWSDSGLLTWILLWLAGAAVVLTRHWRRGAGVGLLLAYILSFGALHWLSATVYLLPWYSTPSVDLTIEGLKQSAIGMIALAAGAEVAGRWRRRDVSDAPQPAEPGIATLYLVAGVLMYAVIGPAASWIPTINTLVGIGSTLTVVGLALK